MACTFGAGAPAEASAGPVHAPTPRPSREQPRGAADLANLASFLSRSSADLVPILISCSAGAHISPSAMEGRIPRASMDVDLTPPCFYSPFRHWMQPVDQSPSPAVATPTHLVLLPRRHRAGWRWSTPEASAESSHPLMLQPFKKSFIPLDEKLQPDVEKATSGQRHRRKATTVDMKCYNLQ